MPTENNTARPEKNTDRAQRPARKPFKKREPKEFDSVVVSINRVSKTTKGGRTMRFAALVVVGDHKGRIGFGMGKAEEAANKNVFRVNLVDGTRTVPHAVKTTRGCSTVFLAPAAPGTGVIAGGAVRNILELAGVSDVLSKVIGSRTSVNVVYATLAALKEMRTVEEVAKARGKKVAEIR